jgi:toxin ParE1/3/4
VKYSIHPVADEELASAVSYYAEVEPELGVRFYFEIERLIQQICEDPKRFRAFDPPARRHFSQSFPYAVIYLLDPDEVVVIAVMHMKQRPGYWKTRIRN